MSEIILQKENFDIYRDQPEIHFVIHEFTYKVDMKKIEGSLKSKNSDMKLVRLKKGGKLYKVINITQDEFNRTQIELTEIEFIA